MLRDWLRKERRTQEWLGERVGTHQTNVSRWVLGRRPPLDMALAIEALTGIPAADWIAPADSTTNIADADALDRAG